AGLAGGQPQDLFQVQLVQRRLRHRQVRQVNRVKRAAEDSDAQRRTSPWPRTTYLGVVRPSRPTGPRACSRSVEMPISAPRPYSKPSAKRVEAFHITEAESTSRRKRSPRARSPVTMASVCCEPYLAMWSIASSRPFTTRTDTTGA